MGDVVRLNARTLKLELQPTILVNLIFTTFHERFPFWLSDLVVRAMFTPLLSVGDDLAHRILYTPLPDATQPRARPPTLNTASSRALRRYIQPPLEADRLHGRPQQWKRFWKARIPHPARTIWWRAIHGKIATGQFRYETWRVVDSPECQICLAPVENTAHMLFLCPQKRLAWTTYLAEYTNKSQWTDAELEDLTSLSRRIPSPKQQHNITAVQLFACGLLGIWRCHYAFAMDGSDFSTQVCLSHMRVHVRRTIAQNSVE